MIIITIPGNPPTQTHQARLRAFKIGAHCRIVKVKPDKATRLFQEELKSRVVAHREGKPGSNFDAAVPVRVFIAFFFPFPKSHRGAKIATAKITRPDLDNMVKTVLDGLTEAGCWADDSQVSSLEICKRYDISPRTIVQVSPDIL